MSTRVTWASELPLAFFLLQLLRAWQFCRRLAHEVWGDQKFLKFIFGPCEGLGGPGWRPPYPLLFFRGLLVNYFLFALLWALSSIYLCSALQRLVWVQQIAFQNLFVSGRWTHCLTSRSEGFPLSLTY